MRVYICIDVVIFSIVEFCQSMIDSLFCFVTCLVRDKIRRRDEKNDDRDKRLYCYKRTKGKERKRMRPRQKERGKKNLQLEIIYLISVYMGDLSLWRVLLEVIFCFLYVSSSIHPSIHSSVVFF